VGELLCLATLQKLDESISKKSLQKYLKPLVSRSSFDASIRILTEQQMVVKSCEGLTLVWDWESKLQHRLETKSACNERKEKGDVRRKAEQTANRMRVKKRELTDAERVILLALPCVVEGCTEKKHQMEHFPAWCFLEELDVRTNRHFVWSICWRHNRDMADFIKTLDNTIYIFPTILKIKPGVNPMRIYSAVANKGIEHFYVAFQNDDHDAATNAIRKVLGLWKALKLLNEADQRSVQEEPLRGIRTKGKRAYSPHDSQLSFRQPLQ
jgi:hypothetical protein